jgi:hypothetical protein
MALAVRAHACAGELDLGPTQLKLVAVPHEFRRLGSRARLGRRHCGAQGLDAGQSYLAVDGAVVLEPQAQQERTERQSLEHQRAKRDAERGRENQVAVGEVGR